MEKTSIAKMYCIKGIMLLPCDKETNTIKMEHIRTLIEDITETIPQSDQDEFMKKSDVVPEFKGKLLS